MSFISKQISKDEARNLMKKYKISSPWPGRDETAVVNMASASVYNADADALFAIIRANFGAAVEGYRNFDGFDGIGVLIWKDTAIRIDYYKNFTDNHTKIFVMTTWILAPRTMEPYEDEAMRLIEDALLTYHNSNLPPGDIARGTKYMFEGSKMEFSDEEDIWKQQKV